jgi:hypothetical protein
MDILIRLVIVAVIVALLIWLINYLPIPPMVKTILNVFIAIIGIIYLLNLLLHFI